MEHSIKIVNKIFLIFIILFFINLFCANAFALSWQEVLALAEKNSNEIKSSQKQLEASRWTYKQSYSNFLPQLSSSLSMGKTSTANSYSYGLTATQYIFKGMENYYTLKSAKADYEYYKADLKKIMSEVYCDLRLAFIDLLIAQENIKLLKNILNRRKENTRLIQLRYESGREDKGNLLLTKASQAESKYNLSSAKRKLKLAQLKLSQLLDQEVSQADENIKVKAFEHTDFDSLVENSPSYLTEKYQLKSAEISKKSTISKFLPSISLSGSYQKSGNTWPPATSRKSWSLNVSYSLFSGGSNLANRIIYSLKLEKAREDFEKTQKETRYNIEEAYEEFKDTLEALDVKKIYLEATFERAKIGRAKYMNGLISYDEWDRIEDAYISAQKSLLSYQNSALNAEASWYKSYGDWVK